MLNNVLRVAFALTIIFSLPNVLADDPNDGPGDTPDHPDVWVDTTPSGGQIITPGDNQPVNESREGNTIKLDFDTEPAADSDVVDISGGGDADSSGEGNR
ncbi:hypothetical protein [Methylomicrobium lacus]|uniref:hypothetical protein n=1 Tax=Methylomicrobium lacus TaxID=136992 RepID=UPI0035A8A5BF